MKVRLIVIDGDMTLAEILHAIQPAALTPPAVQIINQLAAPKPPGEPPRRTNPTSQPPMTGAVNMVRQALQAGPKTAAQVRDWLRTQGHPSLTKRVAQIICALVKQRQLKRDPAGLCTLL